jgi:D-alanyl-D-alanine carboxypeptidase
VVEHLAQRLILWRYLIGLLVGALLLVGFGPVYLRASADRQTSAAAARAPVTQPKTTVRPPPEPWIVGAAPLPRRPDGFGVVRSTPQALMNRKLPTIDRLPPPTSTTFQSTIAPVPPQVLARSSWKPACPVPTSQLRYLTISFRGFDARAHTGEMLVNADVAQTVVDIFKRLFAAGFPIEEMRITSDVDLKLPPTGDRNNTEGFICRQPPDQANRPAKSQAPWPAQAYGLAIDLNPFNNPYVTGDLVVPELASSYLTRDWARPGMALDGGPAVTVFESVGWKWGGRWPGPVSFMHFSTDGR